MFQLKHYVKEIERTGSFSQASKNLFVSQPSLSASIRRLEDKIGVPLFDRSTHPVHLTECGEAYLRAAQSIENAEEDFIIFLEEYTNCKRGHLTIGGSNMTIAYVLPNILRNFYHSFPHLKVEIVEGNIDFLIEQLMKGCIDIVIDSHQSDTDKISERIYKQESLLLVSPIGVPYNKPLLSYALTYNDILHDRHYNPKTPELPLSLLGDAPFIFMTQETDTYKRATQICKRYNFKPNIFMAFNQQSTAFNMVVAKMGVSFISDTLIKGLYNPPDCYFFKLNPSDSSRYLKLYQRCNRYTTQAMHCFYQSARETALLT